VSAVTSDTSWLPELPQLLRNAEDLLVGRACPRAALRDRDFERDAITHVPRLTIGTAPDPAIGSRGREITYPNRMAMELLYDLGRQ
jgi:hypothetical protein